MKKLLALLLLASTPAFAGDPIIGTITSTTTKNNSDTAVPFTIPSVPGGANVTIQCDVDTYVVTGYTTAVTSTAAAGVWVGARVLYDPDLITGEIYIATLPVSAATSNCKVFLSTYIEGEL